MAFVNNPNIALNIPNAKTGAYPGHLSTSSRVKCEEVRRFIGLREKPLWVTTPDEVKAVVDEVKKQAVQKVFMPDTFYGYNERAAITLNEDERNQAVVRLDKIPTDSLEDLRRYIQSLGKTITEDNLRRAYAQRMLNNPKAFAAIVNE